MNTKTARCLEYGTVLFKYNRLPGYQILIQNNRTERGDNTHVTPCIVLPYYCTVYYRISYCIIAYYALVPYSKF